MSFLEPLRVEFSSAEVLPHGESFVLSLVEANGDVHRMELPCWALHQLMRMLPRLDAALLQARQEVSSDLIAYPVLQWGLQSASADRAVALSVRTDRGVESAFLFDPADARALHASLGSTLSAAAPQRRPRTPHADVSAPRGPAVA